MPDVMTPAQRSAFMSSIRGRGTALDLRVFAALERADVRFETHVTVLPRCTPDIVFIDARVVVLIHGDFWHGWRFRAWEAKLTPFWREKIRCNRRRDRRNSRSMARHGWSVLWIWEHEVRKDLNRVVEKIVSFVDRRLVVERSG
jgi:DNA mismatch endonuclease (patch repair protein)